MVLPACRLCSKVIPKHPDSTLPAYAKEQAWVSEVRSLLTNAKMRSNAKWPLQQAQRGLELFERILDGMEQEERDYLEFVRDLERQASEEEEEQEREKARQQQVQMVKIERRTRKRQDDDGDSLARRLAAIKLSSAPTTPTLKDRTVRPAVPSHPRSATQRSISAQVADERVSQQELYGFDKRTLTKMAWYCRRCKVVWHIQRLARRRG